VAGCCKYGDESSGSGATELVSLLWADAINSAEYFPLLYEEFQQI
jgi:hypothetical protein